MIIPGPCLRKPFHQPRKSFWAGCRRPVIIPHMAMGERRARFEGFLRRIDLFLDFYWHGWVIALCR
jgi:hypothetical protein